MKWYGWLGLIILVLMTGVPYATVKAFLYLIEGYPRSAAVELLSVPLNWLQLILVTIPETISTEPYVGIGMIIGLIGIPTLCIWLMKKGRQGQLTKEKAESEGRQRYADEYSKQVEENGLKAGQEKDKNVQQ